MNVWKLTILVEVPDSLHRDLLSTGPEEKQRTIQRSVERFQQIAGLPSECKVTATIEQVRSMGGKEN